MRKPFPNHRAWAVLSSAAAVLVISGCSALPAKPVRPAVYDFGAASTSQAKVAPTPELPAMTMAETTAPTALDHTAIWYRLNYADAQQLRPYALARWSMPPAQLVHQRIHERLAQQRVVLGPDDAPISGPTLRLEVQEFSQAFDSPTSSHAVLRLRATVTGGKPLRVLGQRSWALNVPAASADAVGGVHALSQAVDTVAAELAPWVAGLR